MPVYKIRGVEVEFPYDAYALQLKYMDRVIQSLQEKKHALLESPTGTGKTLCLLCAHLAWRRSQMSKKKGVTVDQILAGDSHESKLPPIIYSSRTHSQLSQAMKEIRKTAYKVKCTILGSRQQQCCNPKLSKLQGTAKNHGCINLIKASSCLWHTAVDNVTGTEVHSHASKVMDIEDLTKLARKDSGPCPYYLTRKMAEVSDIIFVPYNYLVDKRSRQSIATLFDWNETPVIFDEAHNIEQACSEAASFDVPLTALSTAVLELERAARLCGKQSDAGAQIEDHPDSKHKKVKRPTLTKSWLALSERCSTLMSMFQKLESSVKKMHIPKEGKSFPGEHIFELLSAACITDQNWKILTDALTDAAELLVDDHTTVHDSMTISSRLTGANCSLMADALEKAFDSKDPPTSGAPPLHKVYRVHVRDDMTSSGISRIVLSYWCFSPGVAMKQFVTQQNVRNVVLTSGTLSPMDSFAAELHLSFPIQLENVHVIDENQALVACVPTGPTRCTLDSSYKCRDDPRYKMELGQTVLQFLKVIPGGVLMFFPSYVVLENCTEHWKTSKQGSVSLWDKITRIKHAIVEPRNPALFPSKVREYQSKIAEKNSRGCILFAVCRGKVSEGIDFSDDAGRAVILAGIPYAQLTDPKVKLKRDFLDTQRGMQLNGSKWYCQTAIRAVNQAMGRVIRHRNDFGAILLCDRRFREQNVRGQFSKWLQNFITQPQTFGSLLGSLSSFFKKDRTQIAHAQPDGTEKGEKSAEAEMCPGGCKRTSLMNEMQDMAVSPKRQKVKKQSPEPQAISSSATVTPEANPPISAEANEIKTVSKEYSSDPKVFLQQIKLELDAKQFGDLKRLLAEFKETKDAEKFKSTLPALLSRRASTEHLLPFFSAFMPTLNQDTAVKETKTGVRRNP